ncbi:hypothetical protein E2C01_007434 [Portunus trituberculatus]|uniref:Uncharacterized protein n=1 Tax=Portunus trituberculatus TaxID=210409 RepID=A0A5B7D493_PORTR|nr:hypothetical protein [Portunus trituberculatus]
MMSLVMEIMIVMRNLSRFSIKLNITSYMYLISLSMFINLLTLPLSSLNPEKFLCIISPVKLLSPTGVSINH